MVVDMSGRRNSQQAVSAFWTRAKTQSKVGFDKLWATADKLGDPVNRLSNKVGSEAFWPTTLDKESEKAARILRSFCKDGFYQEEVHKTTDGPQQKQRVLKRIPAQVIQNAKGLAIFTTMRTGLWISGAGGSGILVGRKEDGSWSQPAGIMLHTAGLGFLVGVDIYDCVLVLNTQQALDAFSKWRCTIGGEISAVAGPAGIGGLLETEVHKRQAPVFTYLKSRGFYAGVQIDGTVVIERTDEDERFYGEKISAKDIVAGKAQSRQMELEGFMATLKAAEGDKDVDQRLLPSEPPPADMHVVEGGYVFGVPDREDPDPFGFHALEKEGLVLREAGTRAPVAGEQFEFKPSAKSPVYDNFRRSVESSPRSSWRGSVFSTSTTAERERDRERPKYVTSDSATQTDFPGNIFGSPRSKRSIDSGFDEASPSRTPRSQPSLGLGIDDALPEVSENVKENEPETPTMPKPGLVALEPSTEDSIKAVDEPSSASEEEDEAPEIQDVPVVHQVQQATRPQVVTKAKMVAVPKRGPPPKLPPRHPARTRSYGNGDAPETSEQTSDGGSETASIASVVSVGKTASMRSIHSGRAVSIRDDNGTPSTLTPAEEKLQPTPDNADPTNVEKESSSETNGEFAHSTTTNVGAPKTQSFSSPLEKHIASVRSLDHSSSTTGRNFGDSSAPELKRNASDSTQSSIKTNTPELRRTPSEADKPSMASTSFDSTYSQNSPVPRPRPNLAQPRPNAGVGSVSALKNRFESSNRPAPIKTSSTSRPSSSHSNGTNRSTSPLKQLSSYTTSAKEVKAGRITPTTPSPQPDTKEELLPGAFPSDSLEDVSEVYLASEPAHVNGVLDPPPLPPRANAHSIQQDYDDDDTVAGTQEPSLELSKDYQKQFSMAGIRDSLHPLRDDDAESDLGSRSRSVSPMKRPVKLDLEEDFS